MHESESKIFIHSPSKGTKMKPLIPSNKENKRYLLIHGKDLKENIEKAILEFSGILGLSNCGLSFIKSEKEYSIISINREAVNLVRASFSVFSEKMEVLKVSGTLKGLSKK
jgi:RNase P/RNase MRP subunit POP5